MHSMPNATHHRAPAERHPTAADPVAVAGLSKRYRDHLVLDDVSFTLRPGSITGFLGPNGAGKTTTLRLLLGLAAPSAGSALVFGRPYAQLPDPIRRVGAVLESGDFDPGRSGRDHLRTLALGAGIGFERVEELLALVELSAAAERAVRTYSLGMRRRLGLATALLGDPELLLLDEPSNGLDPAGMHWLRGFLRAFADAGGTVLVSSHVLAEVAQTADSVLILGDGRLLAERRVGADPGAAGALEALYLELTTGETR
jgi:ABC-2 type transport system ATP-binding protein